jgi:hypothetical protein
MMRWYARLLNSRARLFARLTAARARVRRGRPLGTADHEGAAPTRTHPRCGARRAWRRSRRCEVVTARWRRRDGGGGLQEFASILLPNRTALDLLHKCHAPKVRVLTYGAEPLGTHVRHGTPRFHQISGDAHSCTVRNPLSPRRLHGSALRCAASLAPLPPAVDARPGARSAGGAHAPLFRVLQYSYSTPAQYCSTPAARRFRSFRRAWRCRCRGRPRCCSCRSSGTV